MKLTVLSNLHRWKEHRAPCKSFTNVFYPTLRSRATFLKIDKKLSIDYESLLCLLDCLISACIDC